MEADRGAERHAGACQLEGHHAAEAEPGRGEAVTVRARLRGEDAVAGEGHLARSRGILEQRTEAGLRLRERMLRATAQVIEGERDVAERRQPVRPGAHVVVLAAALVEQQHPWPDAGTRRLVHREVADHLDALHLVGDSFAVHHHARL